MYKFGIFGDKLWLIRELQSKFMHSYKFNLKSEPNEFEDPKKYKRMDNQDKDFFKLLQIPPADPKEQPRYYFVMKKRTIELLDAHTGENATIIQFSSSSNEDSLTGGLVTGRIPKLKDLNVKDLNETTDSDYVILHYFENLMNYKGEIVHRTYNTFALHADFWQMIRATNGILPVSQE